MQVYVQVCVSAAATANHMTTRHVGGVNQQGDMRTLYASRGGMCWEPGMGGGGRGVPPTMAGVAAQGVLGGMGPMGRGDEAMPSGGWMGSGANSAATLMEQTMQEVSESLPYRYI